jgi:hypothetical protein
MMLKGSFPPLRVVLYSSFGLYCLLYVGCVHPWLHYPFWGWSWLLVTLWHWCFFLYLWTLMVCATTPSSVAKDSAGAEPRTEVERSQLKDMAMRCAPRVPFRPPGTPRYCIWCEQWQPHRAQHCTLCRRCVLRQDHHSRILGHCVDQGTWKAYFLFLLYGFTCCVTAAAWALVRLLEMGQYIHVGPSELGHDESVFVMVSLILLVVGSCFVLPMFSLTLMHMIRAAWRNMTFSENHEAQLLRLVNPAASTDTTPWLYAKATWIDNFSDYLGHPLSWWRPL